jgi:hypothetical protein
MSNFVKKYQTHVKLYTFPPKKKVPGVAEDNQSKTRNTPTKRRRKASVENIIQQK